MKFALSQMSGFNRVAFLDLIKRKYAAPWLRDGNRTPITFQHQADDENRAQLP